MSDTVSTPTVAQHTLARTIVGRQSFLCGPGLIDGHRALLPTGAELVTQFAQALADQPQHCTTCECDDLRARIDRAQADSADRRAGLETQLKNTVDPQQRLGADDA